MAASIQPRSGCVSVNPTHIARPIRRQFREQLAELVLARNLFVMLLLIGDAISHVLDVAQSRNTVAILARRLIVPRRTVRDTSAGHTRADDLRNRQRAISV